MNGSAPSGWQQVAATLVEERGDALLRYAYLLCGSRDDAADLVQDALVRTFGRTRGDFTLPAAEAYVRRAVLNGFLDGTRRSTKWRSVQHLAARDEDAHPSSADDRLDLEGGLRHLSPRERACVVLRYYEDLKVDDIADRLGISPGAVKRYLSDALGKLAATMNPGEPTLDHRS
ncbi:sigma-70 family RNA polymerase sigma factor [Naasia sp. SYSU D00948]|uniref:sigma-70 family RNA polymerase sigma factor n=1 Tax=Naasia sp. SYSU D00948 TaxID=2817379 RepID=UPI001B3177EE|nr:sigma-70 family RNA polymerase sigma factor [Naasia sp. SYSU D00948]